MRPELETQENLKWSVRLCLTVPPAAPPLLPIGQPGKIYDFQFWLPKNSTAFHCKGS